MNLKYKHRLYPTPQQEALLLQYTGAQRYIWNYFLDLEIKEYQSNNKFKFFYQNSKDLTVLKGTTTWLQDGPSTSLQQTLRNLERSLKQSFPKNNKPKGFPKFKKKKNFCGSFELTMVSTKRNIRDNIFRIPKVGDVKCVYHRDLPSDFASCTIKQEAGMWFVVITCQKQKAAEKDIVTSTGVDLGSRSYVTPHNIFEIPKFLRESQAKIKSLQKSLSRKTKGSKNRKKCQLKLAKAHHHVKNQRLDFFHKLSKTLIDSYDLITIEDLDIKQWQRQNGHLVKDNGFAMFRAMLDYKAKLYGNTLVIADRYYPSSQMCSSCGGINRQMKDVTLKTLECVHCGYVDDRDHNAAINLNKLGWESTLMPIDVKLGDIDVLASVLSGVTNEVGKVLIN